MCHTASCTCPHLKNLLLKYHTNPPSWSAIKKQSVWTHQPDLRHLVLTLAPNLALCKDPPGYPLEPKPAIVDSQNLSEDALQREQTVNNLECVEADHPMDYNQKASLLALYSPQIGFTLPVSIITINFPLLCSSGCQRIPTHWSSDYTPDTEDLSAIAPPFSKDSKYLGLAPLKIKSGKKSNTYLR